MVLDHYCINEHTVALLPAKEIDYQTTVLEVNHIHRVVQTPLQLIKNACLFNWSTYEGRRQAVMYHTNYRNKVPIPINKSKNIYAFPTHSPINFNCNWFFPNHILQIKKNMKQNNSTIYFSNNRTLTIDVSFHILEKQFQRTLYCMA